MCFDIKRTHTCIYILYIYVYKCTRIHCFFKSPLFTIQSYILADPKKGDDSHLRGWDETTSWGLGWNRETWRSHQHELGPN